MARNVYFRLEYVGLYFNLPPGGSLTDTLRFNGFDTGVSRYYEVHGLPYGIDRDYIELAITSMTFSPQNLNLQGRITTHTGFVQTYNIWNVRSVPDDFVIPGNWAGVGTRAEIFDAHAIATTDIKIVGGDGTDVVWGGTKNDRLYGGQNRDILIGDKGNDVMYGDDAATGAGAADQLLGGDGNDIAYGGAGNDYIHGEAGNDRLYGGADNDLIYGGFGTDTLYGDAGNDILYGGTPTTLNGGWFGSPILVTYNGLKGTQIGGSYWTVAGQVQSSDTSADRIYGGAGNDRAYGGLGNDTIYGDAGNDTLYGEGGNDRLFGGDGDDTLNGGVGDDYLDGGAGDDTLYGAAGDDRLIGGPGADRLYGNSGVNTADYRGATAGVKIDLLSGRGYYNVAAGDILSGIQVLFGSRYADTFTAAAVATRLYGYEGNDLLIGQGGADRLDGGTGNDRLIGNGGNDTLIGGTGIDTMTGGTGNDYYYVDHASDVVSEGSNGGIDTVYSSVTYSLASRTHVENITLTGTASINATGNTGNNVLTGNSGNNKLYGGDGNDTFIGGGGTDYYHGGAGEDTYVGAIDLGLAIGAGTMVSIENVAGTLANETIRGDFGNNKIFGNGGNDTLFGGDGNDWIEADPISRLIQEGVVGDHLLGGAGNDTLIGGTGCDYLQGGTGADTFVYRAATDLGTRPNFTCDFIEDFNRSEGDRIDLSLLDGNPYVVGHQDLVFVTTPIPNNPGQFWIPSNSWTIAQEGWSVYFDLNGDMISEFELKVLRMDGDRTLSASDFIL